MFKNITAKLTLIAAGLLAAGAAQAADDGWFVDGRAGIANFDHHDLNDNSGSLGANVGYRWGTFGVEAGYTDLGEFSDLFTFLNTVDHTKVKLSGYNVGGNAKWALGKNWFFGARLGVFRWDGDQSFRTNGQPTLKVSEHGVDWYAGINAGYDFNENWGLGLALDHYTARKHGSKLDTDVLSAKVEYRFK